MIHFFCKETMRMDKINMPILGILMSLFFTFYSPDASSQTKDSTGTVFDYNGKPLSGVKVKNQDSKKESITSINGKYTMILKNGDHLYFEHPKFYPYVAEYQSSKDLQVQLAPKYLDAPNGVTYNPDAIIANDNIQYTDVLHGRQPRVNVIQSISTVNNNQLVTTPSAQLFQALPGKLAGFAVNFNNGIPGLDGTGISYGIRGARAQTILIDGVERGYTSIDPEQIESISVLKDALATVMFGQRSSNGIISIITKKGNSGSPRISFTAQTAIQSPIALPKPLDAAQYAILYNEAQKNDAGLTAVAPRYSQNDIDAFKNGTDPIGHPNVDWYNTVLNPNSRLTKYNFNVQGSGKGFRYFVDLDNLKETGLLKTIDSNVYNTNAQLDRYIVRTNVGVDVTSTTLMQLNLFGRIQRNNQPGGSTQAIFNALSATPQNAYPVFNPDGSLAGNSQYAQNANIYGQAVYRGYQFSDLRDMAVDLQVTQKLDFVIPGLYLKAQGSYNNSTLYTTNRAKDFAVFQLNANNTYTKFGNTTAQGSTGTANDRNRVTYLEAAIGYDGQFGKNNVSALILSDKQSTLPFASGNLPETYTDHAVRLTYNWDNKYLIEGAGTYSGYAYFAPKNRFAFFYAGGIGWNIHNESFIKNNAKWISQFKLRATYGLTGQANSGYYTYIQTYWTPTSNTSNNDAYWFGPGSLERSTGQNALVNPNLVPEKAKKINLAMDLGLWNNKLTVTAEYFKNKFFDLLGTPGTTTTLLGTNFPQKNLQKFDYWGTDLSITYQDRVNNFNYFITGNFSMVQSKIIFNDEVQRKYSYQQATGRQVGLLYGYTAAGLFQSYEEINDPATAVFAATPKSSLRPGDIRYVDLNGDGIINNDDSGAIGSGKPIVYYGATLGFNYRGFDFSALVQGTLNRVSLLGGPTGQNGDFFNGFGNNGNGNAYEYNLGRWTPETAPTATQPRLWLGNNVNNQQVSTYWIRNSDFIRLKNVELGYTFPTVISKKIGVPSIRLFANGLNLLTASEIFAIRDDIDPEVIGATYPLMRVYNFGISAKF